MNTDRIHRIFFIGIGGIGMSALARWFLMKGLSVAGYDRTNTPLTGKLTDLGIGITYTDDPDSIPAAFKTPGEDIKVVYTPAIPAENRIMNYFRENGFEIRKRSEVLGQITADHFTVAVAGTHGKTTTSSLIAHILRESGRSMVSFLGGITVNYDSNVVTGKTDTDNTPLIVVEADEYDRSFLTLNPDIGIVTALDADHLDIYGSEAEMQNAYAQFLTRIRPDGKLIISKRAAGLLRAVPRNDLEVTEYALEHNPVRAADIRIEKEETRFSYISPELTIENIPLAMSGYHNVENAVAAITACLSLRVNETVIKSALATFRGIKRRFEYMYYSNDVVYIDDYAHHPEEIRAFVSSVRNIFPDKKITAVFQPHLFSRTRDFADGFARSLSIADEVILLDIYPAREKPIPGITSKIIFDRIQNAGKKMIAKEELIDYLGSTPIEVILTIGAGDIDQLVHPIKTYLEKRYEISE